MSSLDAPAACAMNVDEVAEAMWNCRPRRLEWKDLSDVGWRAEYRAMAEAAIRAIGLTPEYKNCADGSGGISYRTDKAGRTVSRTSSGRTPTQMVRWATRWEVSRPAQEYSSTVHYDPPEVMTYH